MSGLDLDLLRRLNEARRDPTAHWNARELARNSLQGLLMRETDAILAALERIPELERSRASGEEGS